MFQIPGFMLKQLYVQGSLSNRDEGFAFTVRNPFMDATIVGVHKLSVDGQEYDLTVVQAAGYAAVEVTPQGALSFPRGADLQVEVSGDPLASGSHNLYLKVETHEFGPLKVDVTDRVR